MICFQPGLQQPFDIFMVTPHCIWLFCSDAVYSFLSPPGRFLTTQQTCVSKCPGGFFASRLSGVCEVCPVGCLQCVDAQHCTRCQSTRKAQLFLQDGQCVQECVRSGANPLTIICLSKMEMYFQNLLFQVFRYCA